MRGYKCRVNLGDISILNTYGKKCFQYLKNGKCGSFQSQGKKPCKYKIYEIKIYKIK